MNIHIVVLEDLVRQEGDVLFQKLLQIVRKGKCTDNIMKVLLKLKDTKFPDDIQPTRLYPVNVDVDKINAEEVYKLRKLGNPTIVYRAKASINNENIKAKYDVQLTDEAQVMITRNIDVNEGLVNGKRGVIAYLDSEFVLVKDVVGKVYKIEYFRDYCNNDYKSWIDHMPLKICYALSIHKSQGMTIDAIEIDLGKNIFTAGQAYTALSRAKSLNSIKIIDVDKDSFKINPFVKKFYESKIGI
jgi:ATP-dependent DNA helicase PIF1